MSNLVKNLSNLLKVKTVVTLVVIAVFAVLALRGTLISAAAPAVAGKMKHGKT